MGLAATGRVVWSGHLGGGEEFSTGFWVSASSISDQGSVDNLNANIAQVFEAHHSNLCSVIPASCGYDNQRLYWYDTTDTSATHISDHPFDSIVGTAGTTHGWNGLSAVVTLHTDTAGRSGRGRMYIPALALAVSDGLFASDSESQIIVDMVSIFNGINGIDEQSPAVVVYSAARGAVFDVTSLSLDNKPDRQERREKSVVASVVHTEALA